MAHLTTLDDPDEQPTTDGDREHRARTEEMVVIPHTTDDGIATGIYDVHSASSSTYLVDLKDDHRCNCPDAQHNQPENGCKHWQRVKMAVEETSLPASGESAADYYEELAAARDDLLAAVVEHEERVATMNYLVEAIDSVLDHE